MSADMEQASLGAALVAWSHGADTSPDVTTDEIRELSPFRAFEPNRIPLAPYRSDRSAHDLPAWVTDDDVEWLNYQLSAVGLPAVFRRGGDQ